jgi:two-component system, response regulator PdtaR
MSACPVYDQTPAVKSPTILVVEDEILIRMMVATELRTAGFIVIEAAGADDALKVLQSSQPVDLMVTDIAMPGSMDGAKLAMLVHATWPNVKIMIASAYSPEWPASTSIHAYVGKPYNPERLIERIRLLLKSEVE